MADDFSTIDIQKMLDIPPERFRAWTKEGYLIEPTIPASGKGSRASYSSEHVYCIALFKSLLDKGFHRRTASTLIKSFWRQSFDKSDVLVNLIRTQGERDITLAVFGFTSDDPNEKPYLQVISGPLKNGKYELDEYGVEGKYSTIDISGNTPRWSHMHIVNISVLFEKVDSAIRAMKSI